MGTQKRERQKANRQQRLIEEAKAERSATVKRNVLRWSLAAVLAVAAVVLIAWIGGAFTGDDETATTIPDITVPVDTTPIDTTPEVTTAPGDTTPADEASGKPSVLVPEELPTELVVTVVEDGTGDPAEVGDQIEVDYVGVRSADGVEFDNSFDRGSTFVFEIGADPRQVIEGWDTGLVGATEGSVIQLDMPAELAYGDSGSGAVIRPGDALSFVIEVVSITPGVDE